MSLTGMKGEDLANINRWVKEATEGKIEDFLSDLPDDTVLLLLNAIHFQGELLPFSVPTCSPYPCPAGMLCSEGPSFSPGLGWEAVEMVGDRSQCCWEEAQELDGAFVESSLRGAHGKPLQYSCLENPKDRGAWWATVHEVAESRT